MSEPLTHLYRITGSWDESGFNGLICWRYEIEKLTPCGAWLRLWGHTGDKYGRKFVNLAARKQWASATADAARVSFLARRRLQIRILNSQIDRAQRELEAFSQGPIRELTFL